MAHGFYTVQRRDLGEGLLGIARRFYNDPRFWPTLYQVNRAVIGENPSLLRPGQQLLLPDLIPEGRDVKRSHLYLVELRDLERGLPGVAERLWGDAARWRELYALNRGVIGDDPRAIVPGQWLVLPEPPRS